MSGLREKQVDGPMAMQPAEGRNKLILLTCGTGENIHNDKSENIYLTETVQSCDVADIFVILKICCAKGVITPKILTHPFPGW